MGVLSGRQARAYAEADVVAGEMNGGKWVLRGDFKAAAVAPPFGDGQWRLYDISQDPGETHDLSAARAGLLEELIAAWERYTEEVGVVTAN